MNTILFALFIVLPYISLMVLIIGVAYRIYAWASTAKGANGLYLGLYRLVNRAGQHSYAGAVGYILSRMFIFNSIIKRSYGRDYGTWLGVFLFHWGIFLLIIFHLHLWMPWITVSEEVMYVMGMSTGAVALAAGLFLLIRRINLRRIYGLAMNALDDYVAISWVILILIMGLLLRATSPPQLFSEATDWAIGLASLHPVPPPAYMLFYIHVLLVELFMIYVPFSKMVHPFTFPVNPILYGKFEDIDEVEKSVERKLGW
ncbi:MAG: respiratory nitrate reductase subunit gamma [Thermocladium sp.]|jgi:nitrate reductase gamma subunit